MLAPIPAAVIIGSTRGDDGPEQHLLRDQAEEALHDASVRRSVVFGLGGFVERAEVRERLSEARDQDPNFDVRRAAASVLRGAEP